MSGIYLSIKEIEWIEKLLKEIGITKCNVSWVDNVIWGTLRVEINEEVDCTKADELALKIQHLDDVYIVSMEYDYVQLKFSAVLHHKVKENVEGGKIF